GLDEQGRLLLDTDAGRRIVDAADIALQGGLTAPPARTAEG
ncbi:MAG: hypothetical protein FJ077_16755, partial [Cyanobacteria bacterium K_DeepCast_35m_m2_023]|nr:hypothetical protein [Cyanobacteria bacterium K_DeepCast_35m_m2_023]